MIRSLLLIGLAVLALIGGASASWSGPDGLQVLEVDVREVGWIERLFDVDSLAIATDRGVYSPGAEAAVTIGSAVPCTTRYAYLVVERVGGGEMLSRDITGLLTGTCITQRLSVRMNVPTAAGDYAVAVVYRDGQNRELYRDEAFFRVGASACLRNSCTEWTNVESVPFGDLQVKSCTLYGPAPECRPRVEAYNRVVCDDGYELTSTNECRAKVGSVCGNGVQEAGEVCDDGFSNGACPSRCSAACTVNACSDLELITPPQQGGDVGSERGGVQTVLLVLGLLLVVGGLILQVRQK